MVAVLDVADELDGQEPVHPGRLVGVLAPALGKVCEGRAIERRLKLVQVAAANLEAFRKEE